MSDEFSKILRDYLTEERGKNPSVNETTISKKMGVPSSTFNRLLNGNSSPSLNTVLKLSHFIPELKEILPDKIATLLKVTLERKNTDYITQSLETLLYDKDLFLCWLLAFSSEGITLSKIKDCLGQKGADAIKILEKYKIVSKCDNIHYKLTETNKDTILSFNLIKAHCAFLIEQYKPTGDFKNYIHYWADFLNEEGRRKIMKVHQEAHRKIMKVMKDTNYKGDTLVFSTSCSDVLAETNTNNEET